MDFYEKTVSTNRIYEGKVINFKVDTVLLPGGHTSLRELVEHPGGVAVVAVDSNDNVIMVEQFRKPYDKMILEIPAGKMEKGEDPKACGMRELEEETGMKASNFEFLGECYPSVGYTNEIIRIFLATGLQESKQNLDEDEFLNVRRIPIKKLMDMIMNNEIADAKTVIGILKASIKLKKI